MVSRIVKAEEFMNLTFKERSRMIIPVLSSERRDWFKLLTIDIRRLSLRIYYLRYLRI